MKFRIERSFDRDVDGIRDKKLLRKLQAFVSAIENADSIQEIPHLKKIEGYKSYYRTKIGDHRLGIEAISKVRSKKPFSKNLSCGMILGYL